MEKYKAPYYIKVGHTYYVPRNDNPNKYHRAILMKIMGLDNLVIIRIDGEEYCVPVSVLRLKNQKQKGYLY